MYLIYVFDLPLLFHDRKLTLEEEVETEDATVSTFVDDAVTTVELTDKEDHQLTVNNTMNLIEEYTKSNKLVLNRENTKFLVISKKKSTKEKLELEAQPINIKPISNLKFLGMNVSEDLKCNKFLLEGKLSVLSQLKIRVAALKKIRNFTKNNQFRKFSNGIFISKLLYGAKLWSGAPVYMRKQIQSQMIKVAHLNLGFS